MSELALGKIKGLTVNSNVVTVPVGHTLYAPGHVVQVQQAVYSTAFNTTSQSFVAAGLSVNITPKYATSKIYVVVNNSHWSASNSFVCSTIYRGTTNLGNANGLAFTGAGSAGLEVSTTIAFLDSPATTSQLTYTHQIRSYYGGTVYAQNANIPATITVMEIAA